MIFEICLLHPILYMFMKNEESLYKKKHETNAWRSVARLL